MTLLDTHIWLWWCEGNPRLKSRLPWLDAQPRDDLAISIFTIWEIAKLSEIGRISLPDPVLDWVRNNLIGTGVQVIPLSKEIAVEACALPKPFHQDPADQIIVSTARALNCELLTVDGRILLYPHVKTITV